MKLTVHTPQGLGLDYLIILHVSNISLGNIWNCIIIISKW